MILFFILGGVLLVVGIYVMGVYNSLQNLKSQITASVQEIGNQLKRQASLIPNLEASVKGFLKHEKDIFELLTSARKSITTATNSGSAGDLDTAITQLQAVVPKMMIAIEDNPELKSDATVMRFMQELSDTADKLSYARRSVIDLSQLYNVKLMVFPSNLVANLFGFKPEKGLETPMSGAHLSVSDSETQDVKVSL